MTVAAFEKPQAWEKSKAEATISLLLPAHNEADTIEKIILDFYQEIGTKIPLEIVVSEDGSTDRTKNVLLELSKKIPLTLILCEERKGYMNGVKDGLRKATGEYIFFSDSDGQHIPSDFWKLYEKRNSYDLIVGRKIKRQDPAHRIVISTVFHILVKIFFGMPLRDPDTAYRLIRRRVLDEVIDDTVLLKYSFWTEFTVRAFKKGFKVTEVPVVHKSRLQGDTRLYKSSKLFSIIVSQMLGLLKLWRILRKA